MNSDLQTRLLRLENLIKIQRDSIAEDYMHGMLNGLIIAHSVFTDDYPAFVSKYKQPTNIRHKNRKKR